MNKDKLHVNIDSRLLKLLDELSSQSENYIPMNEYADKLNLSRRQVEYDILRLNDIFQYLNLPEIMSVKNKGIKIAKENIAWFTRIFRHNDQNARFNYKGEERVAFIIIHIIIGGSKYSYEDFCDILKVSRTTIFEDIKLSKEISLQYDLTLDYDLYYNYYIDGSGKNLMALLKSCATTLFKNIPKELFRYLVEREVYDQIIKL